MVIYFIVLELDVPEAVYGTDANGNVSGSVVVCVGRQRFAGHVGLYGYRVGPGFAVGEQVRGGWRGPGTTDGAGAGVEVVVVDCFCCACQQPAKPNGTASMSRNLQEAFESGRDWLRCTYLLWSWSKWLRADLFPRSAATV